MLLEDYFDFLGPDDIRVKGHRIGVEDVLYEYLYNEKTPAELAERFPTLMLEEIYAVLLYYHHHKSDLDQYLTRWLEFGRRAREEQERNLPPVLARLRQLTPAQREAILQRMRAGG